MLRATVVLLVVGLTGCGGAQTDRSNLSYGENARDAFEAAMSDFRDGDCLDAQPAFREVRRKYPYSRFAALSELRIADCMMEEETYTEAIAAYRRFVRNRPSHPEVPYARFRIAEAYFEQIPDDWLLSPPAHELDQGPTREALRQLRRFVLDYPEDDRVERANDMTRQALAMLARHELYVAEFYLDGDHPQAAVGRLQTILSAYEGSGIEPEAMLLLGQVYLAMREGTLARETFRGLTERYPRSGYAEQARGYLEALAP